MIRIIPPTVFHGEAHGRREEENVPELSGDGDQDLLGLEPEHDQLCELRTWLAGLPVLDDL